MEHWDKSLFVVGSKQSKQTEKLKKKNGKRRITGSFEVLSDKKERNGDMFFFFLSAAMTVYFHFGENGTVETELLI